MTHGASHAIRALRAMVASLVLALVRSMTLKRWRKLMDDEDRFLLLGFVEKDCEKLGLTYDQAITAWNLGKDLVLANKEKEDDA